MHSVGSCPLLIRKRRGRFLRDLQASLGRPLTFRAVLRLHRRCLPRKFHIGVISSRKSLASAVDIHGIRGFWAALRRYKAAGTLKRKAPGRAPAPRAKRSSGEIAAPVIAKMQLSKTQAAAVLAHKAVSDKQGSAAQSARRQSAKQNKSSASAASASTVDELAKKNAARLVAALAADENGSDEDGNRSHLKKQKVRVVEGQEDDSALLADMPLLMEVSSKLDGEGAGEVLDETDEGIDDNGVCF
ncbi:hypothetical protein FB107DRAFT_280801 [Schizophyllum commune]